MKINFKNKTILITGASKGIGYEIAKSFLRLDANVCICSRSKKNLGNAKKELLKISSESKILCVQYDTSDIKKQNSLIKLIKKKFNSNIDILINNTGGPKTSKIEKTSLNDWKKTINSNLLGTIMLTKKVVNVMKKKKWGRIINLTSTTAKEPAENMVLSNVTRAGLTSFSKTLSLEIGKYGITVNTILTGGCLTDRLFNLIKNNSKNKKDFKSQLKSIINSTPLKKIAEPYEFIQMIIFLSSENASYINGVAIPIDGGTSKSMF